MKILLTLLLICQVAWGRELTIEQKLSDMNELIGHIKSGYGPLVYKKEKFGIDVDVLKDKYQPLIVSTKSNAEFYYLIVKFVAEFNDSHFGARLPTNFVTYLGFNTDLVAGKILIDEIKRDVLPVEKFPFEKGDEIVSFNGKPIMEELRELLPYFGEGQKITAERSAAMILAVRQASKVPAQTGKVIIEVRRGNSSITEKVELEWLRKGKFTDEFKPLQKSLASIQYNRVDYNSLKAEDKFLCSGESRIKIPSDATIVVKEPFVAYYYPTEKGNVGYLRIPHYSPEEKNPNADSKGIWFNKYEYAVNILEKKTVGLIIDQDHNCGGNVDWMHRILSLFIEKPVKPLQFELLATKASVIDLESWLAETYENTIEYEYVSKLIEFIKNTWLESTTFLSPKTALSGFEYVYPNAIRYTKPVIVLADEMSVSCGDAFPALIQGYGRAKILGTRTMGGGGHVVKLPPLNNSQIKVRMTKSLFYRPDGVAVENNGVEPDIKYSPSVNDFKYGYQEYQQFYTSQLLREL